MLEDFEKEEALLRRKIEARLSELNAAHADECQDLVEYVAETVASTVLMRYRFDCFEGGELCIVTSTMGSNNQYVRDSFRREVDDLELATAVWPKMGKVSTPKDAHYSWAVLINDCDCEHWREVARKLWVVEGG